MIPVQEQPEPPDFSTKVRIPGQDFLKKVPQPTNKQFKKARHWRNCVNDLYMAYQGICAYSAHWIPPGVTRITVDHFIPKDKDPNLAYEWSNFRLCSEKINNYKDDEIDVMDPFNIKYDWFIINFTTFFIEAEDSLPTYLKDAVNATIRRLRLNDDDGLVQERANYVQLYIDSEIPFNFLERRYPFIAYELNRQGLKETIKSRSKKPSV